MCYINVCLKNILLFSVSNSRYHIGIFLCKMYTTLNVYFTGITCLGMNSLGLVYQTLERDKCALSWLDYVFLGPSRLQCVFFPYEKLMESDFDEKMSLKPQTNSKMDEISIHSSLYVMSHGMRHPSGHLSTPVITDSAASAFLLPNYKQGMFASGSSQVTIALGACLAVKSELLPACVIDVSGSEVTPRSNMNMEWVELSDGRWDLTTSADKINWKQLPIGAWAEHVRNFLFLSFFFFF